MPLRLDVKKKFSARSDRVKCVDVHPTEPWILASLYNGHVYIWNYTTQNIVKSFEVTDLPVRTTKFVARKQWVITGSDDMNIRCYNYNTMEKIKAFEAHSDYIRCLAVHPTQPYILSSSDDMLIKLWDWDKGWINTQVFEGHTHYVMSIAINPKDPNIFATASLDRTIKVWGLGSTSPYFTLEGHDKGVNCVEYFIGGEKPYLVSGADDKLVKVWDYQNKTCVQTLEGHTNNVSVVCFHPELPVIISGSEDGSVRIWHANTYRLEKTLNYGMERVWALGYLKGANVLALGYDEGTALLKLGREEPAVTMDQGGKIIWARHNEIQTANIKSALDTQVPDGERLPLSIKDLGNCEVYPQKLKHNANGRFVVACGDGEYIIYTSLAWRNKSFGSALDFVWAPDTGAYAVRETSSKVKVFKNFKETKSFKPTYSAEGIFGGTLLAVKSTSFVCFYDWEECNIIRRIDVNPKQVYWSDNSEFVAITTENSFFILQYRKDQVQAALESGQPVEEDGIEEAFEVLFEISERVRTAAWVGDCFIYTNNNNRLNYCVGGETVTISHLDRHMYLLGYIPENNKIYLIDKALNVVSYTLHISIINYQTAILRKDYEAAAKLLPKIPEDHRTRIAQFLESQNLKEEALEVTLDLDHKFELALQLGKLDTAHEILLKSESEQKWRQLADLALSSSKFDLAEKCMRSADDLGGLLLLFASTGNAEGLAKLAQLAADKGQNNVSFVAYFLLRRLEDCLDLLCNTGRIPEAAFLARTYLPSHVPRIVALWRADLATVNAKAAQALADPMEYGNLFPDLQNALLAEQVYAAERTTRLPADAYLEHKSDILRNLIEEAKSAPPPLKPVGFSPLTQATPPLSSQPAPSSPAPAAAQPITSSPPARPRTPEAAAPAQQSPVVTPAAQRTAPLTAADFTSPAFSLAAQTPLPPSVPASPAVNIAAQTPLPQTPVPSPFPAGVLSPAVALAAQTPLPPSVPASPFAPATPSSAFATPAAPQKPPVADEDDEELVLDEDEDF